MDKIKKYQNILVSYLEKYSKIIPANLPDIDSYVISDRKNNHFQLLQTGWQGSKYVFTVVFHFDIKEGKIWLQRNITEREIIDELAEMGVDKNDIVLGFRSPYIRSKMNLANA